MTDTAQGNNMQPDAANGDRLCLLSLDGGGVRGLSSLYILHNIMTRLNFLRLDRGLQRVRPCEVFDLIGGTSTGGLIAIMLGRLGMKVEDCIKAYSDLMAEIFNAKLSKPRLGLTGKLNARFDSDVLHDAIKSVIRNRGLKEDEPFHNSTSEHSCRVFVCVADTATSRITRLRSYERPKDPNRDHHPTICEAALATCAAPSIFSVVKIGKRKYADGAMGANNPIEELVHEARELWDMSGEDELRAKLGCVLSIGTGSPATAEIHGSAFKFLAQTLKDMATETEKTETRFSNRGWGKKTKYYRFNVQNLDQVGLVEHEASDIIEGKTEVYLEHQDRKDTMQECVEDIIQGANLSEILSLINKGQDDWSDNSTPWHSRPSNAHPKFKNAKGWLLHYRNRSPRYSLPLVHVNLCIANNYRLEALCRGNETDATQCLDAAYKYLKQAEDEAGRNMENERCKLDVSLLRLWLEATKARVGSSTGVIDRPTARRLSSDVTQLQQQISSTFANPQDHTVWKRSQDLIDELKDR